MIFSYGKDLKPMTDNQPTERKKPPPEKPSDRGRWFSVSPEKTKRLAAIAAASLIAALLVGPGVKFAADVYLENDVAETDVRAMRNFMATDTAATETARKTASEKVKTIYDFNPDALENSINVLKNFFGQFSAEGADKSPAAVARTMYDQWSISVTKDLASKLLKEETLRELEAQVADSLDPLYRQGVVANRDMLIRESSKGIIIRNTLTGAERVAVEPRKAVDFDTARRELSGGRKREASTIPVLGNLMASELVSPNLVFNPELTAKKKREAAENLQPVLYQVRKGEMLVREGDRVTLDQERKLASHAKEIGESGASVREYAALFLSLFLLAAVSLEFGRANIRKARTAGKDLLFVAFTLVTMLAIQRGMALFAQKLGQQSEMITLVVPMAAAIIAIRMVLNSETALIAAIPYLAAASIGSGAGTGYFFPLALGSLLGAHAAGQASKRVEYLKIGLITGIAQGAAMILVLTYKGSIINAQTYWNIAGAFTGGLLSGIAALGLVPLAETLFGYTTDMRLMELSNFDHPLLKEMMIRAPGTYHHSMVTGTLVKSASEAIGGRAVLATVAAYYHDVGKMSKHNYFIENQEGGKNPHDKLAPSMSALILTSHVKEGVELAREYKLGKELSDVIEQHHGTTLIRYFYKKAQDAARPGVEEVREEEYRYPGPKPQTREAAVVMLADAVEAAARTLPDPKPARIQGMVQTIINRIFADGQLDECDLALKDLHKIARSFTHILSGIHHQRIDYPLPAHKEKKDDGSLDTKRQSDGRTKRGDTPQEGEENLKRLGM